MVISVLISTINEGINNVKNVILSTRSDINYIVIHQFTNDNYKFIPFELRRDDVMVYQSYGRGLTKSRNYAISKAKGDICIIADDDVKYKNEYFDTILKTYKQHEIDIACFKVQTSNEDPDFKNYPEQTKTISTPFELSISSIEITFRREVIVKNNIFFDENFGLGSYLAGGEETVFIFDAIKKGLRIKFFPEYIVEHPYERTCLSFANYDKTRIKVIGALDARIHGHIAYLKVLGGTLKHLPDLIKYKKNPVKYLYERLIGVLLILKK